MRGVVALKVCPTPGCPELVPRGRCAGCTAQAEQRRGTSTQRGYGRVHRTRFRDKVLARDPICVVCMRRASTVADHYPLSRRELLLRHMNADDPSNGRGLCAACHSAETALNQPGGWNASNI